MDLSTVKTALDLLGNASRGLESVRERAKTSNDAALKESISKLYDDFLDLKAIIVRLTEENAELREQVSQGAEKPRKPEIRQFGDVNYYFVGEEGPYCQPCFDRDNKLVPLTPKQHFAAGNGRKCLLCEKVFLEVFEPPRRRQVDIYPWDR